MPVDIPEGIALKPVPFEEAIEYFRSLGLALSEEEALALWRETGKQSFYITGVRNLDALEDAKGLIDDALAEGKSLGAFKKEFEELMRGKGWAEKLAEAGLTKKQQAYRVETIYRNNVQAAYNAGRWEQQQRNKSLRSYLEYDAVDDGRVRPSHASMDGKVYPVDDPVWDEWYPPNGHGCRCKVRSRTGRDIERRNLTIERSDVSPPTINPDSGWERNPGKSDWRADPAGYSGEGKKILASIEAIYD